MMQGYRVRAKIAVARFKWLVFRLFLFSLGVIVGVSFLVAYQAYGEAVVIEIENVPLPVEKPVAVKNEAKEVVWSVAEFTAYSKGDGFTPGSVMASGKEVYEGALACPRYIPLGTKIEVNGLGVFTCEDRMSKRFPDRFDVYLSSVSEALQFGVQSLNYRVVDKSV